jgi:hypothetical protein
MQGVNGHLTTRFIDEKTRFMARPLMLQCSDAPGFGRFGVAQGSKGGTKNIFPWIGQRWGLAAEKQPIRPPSISAPDSV